MRINLLQIKKIDFVSFFSMLLLFLAGMNFNNFYYYFFFLGSILIVLGKKKIIIDGNFGLLAILALSLLIFSPDSKDKLTSMIKPFLYVLSYAGGMCYISTTDVAEHSLEEQLVKNILILSWAPFVHYMLNFIINVNNGVGRNTIDFWTHSIIAATLQGAMSCMIVGVACGKLCSYASKMSKFLSWVVLLFVVVYNLILGGRTVFFVIIFVFSSLLLVVVFRKEKSRKKNRIIVGVIILIVVICLAYMYDVRGIRTWVEQSNFYYRFWGNGSIGFGYDTRLHAKMEYLKNFTNGIFGGQKIKDSGIGYAHDILLDTYDDGGVFALLAMFLFLVGSITELARFLKNKCWKFETKQILLGVYLSMYIIFMLEPILQGAPWLFVLFCFINGQLARTNRIAKKRKMV